MSHPEQLQFVDQVRRIFPRHFDGARVLEIGSLDINGTIRSRFVGCDYTGIDVAEGPGVDVVCQGQDYAGPDAAFDTVISCEVMEHNPHWVETFRNMARLCRPGGLVVMTCASWGRREHGTSRSEPDNSPLTVGKGWDYYRNLRAEDFLARQLVQPFADWAFFQNWRSYDLYFVGSRSPLDQPTRAALADLARGYHRGNFQTFKGLKRYLKAHLLVRR